MTPETIAETLKADIAEGRLPPGTELRQENLAARFGTSRMPVRDALNILALTGLIQIRRNRGAQVTQLSAAALRELFHMRKLLELDCLRRAMPSMVPADLDSIAHTMKVCEIEAGRPDFPSHDWRFHEALYAPAGTPIQIATIADLRLRIRTHTALYDVLREQESQWSYDHRKIVAAVECGDAEAAEAALADHLDAAEKALLTAMAG